VQEIDASSRSKVQIEMIKLMGKGDRTMRTLNVKLAFNAVGDCFNIIIIIIINLFLLLLLLMSDAGCCC